MKLKDAKKKEGIKEACMPHENKRARIVILGMVRHKNVKWGEEGGDP